MIYFYLISSSDYLKINFDCNVLNSGAHGGDSFVIKNINGALITVCSIGLVDMAVAITELGFV